MAKHYAHVVLSPPFPAPPARPAAFELQFLRDNTFELHNFYSMYAAKHFLDEVIRKKKLKWLSSTEATLDSLTIKSDQLEQIIEYEFNPTEKEWELPDPYPLYAERIREGKMKKRTSSPTPRASSPRTRTPAPDGATSLAQLCVELKIDTRQARQILRKHKVPKPYAWKDTSTIAKLLKGAK